MNYIKKRRLKWNKVVKISSRKILPIILCVGVLLTGNTFLNNYIESNNRVYAEEIQPDIVAPTKPNNLIPSNKTDTTINLNWDKSSDNIGVVSYQINKDQSVVNYVYSESYQATNLLPCTTYNFYVKAKDAAGNMSDPSETISITT